MPFSLRAICARAGAAGEYATAMARLARDLPPFVRTTLTLDEAKARVRQQLALREQRLLALVERGIYAHPSSPFLALLRHAGCELGDVRALIHAEGIEGGLRVLADRGVYITFDEMKGMRETVRGSFRRTFTPNDFNNPLMRPHLFVYTGGSGRSPSRVPYSLPFVEDWAVSGAVVQDAHGVQRPRQVCWWPVPMAQLISSARMGNPTLRWFYPVHPLPAIARLAAYYVAGVGRLAGVRLPLPERCDLERPAPLATWLAKQLESGDPIVLWTLTGLGARLGLAATELGLDLTGVTLLVSGEPVTEDRRRQIEGSGARLVVVYGSMDVSASGYSCATPTAVDDVHMMTHRCAVYPRPRPAMVGGPVVNALMATTISRAVPKIAFNTEMGDYAELEERDCGCGLGELGLRTHMSEIRSFEKLTGEGVTFARSNLEQIVEQILPDRFGGTSMDYQLAEERTADGVTHLVIRVDPAVPGLDESALRTFLLTELGRTSLIDRYQAEIWRNAGILDVRRETPLPTRGGKVLPFRLLDASTGVGRSS